MLLWKSRSGSRVDPNPRYSCTEDEEGQDIKNAGLRHYALIYKTPLTGARCYAHPANQWP